MIRFVLNQQTITGIALYAPIAARKRAEYWVLTWLWTVKRMAKPEMAMQIGIIVKRKRCLTLSEIVAMIIAKVKEAAQGGTERSWVWIAIPLSQCSYTFLPSMVGPEGELTTVPKLPDYGRRKVCISVGRNDETKVHESSDEDFVIFENAKDLF